MAIVAGIDEAGLGPILGPLVVSGVAFRVPDDAADACLWDKLHDTCTRDVTRSGRRLAVADSKRLYRSGGGIAPLERTALVMHAAGRNGQAEPDHDPAEIRAGFSGTWRALLAAIAPEALDELDRCPWYGGCDLTLPLSEHTGDIGTRANAVRLNLAREDIEAAGTFVELLPAGQFNRLAAATRNKSVVLLGQALRVIDRILRAAPDEPVRLYVDRLGGRVHYREALQTAMPAADMRILEEGTSRSAYRLRFPSRTVEIRFDTNGEQGHFCVALASIYSKYVRELCMYQFNRYWCEAQPGLKPTAGYYADAQRWLRDAQDSIRRLGIGREMLVRSR